MDRVQLIPELLELFRENGYEGVSIATVSKATGLGKSSLYHHFPGGKEEMANEVLQHIDAAVKQYFIAPLKGDGSAEERLATMCKNVEQFYDGGKKNCIVDGLTLGEAGGPFQEPVAQCVEAWVHAMSEVAVSEGVSKKSARERAEGALVAVEGGLIASRALRNYQIFKREVRNIPHLLLNGTTAGA